MTNTGERNVKASRNTSATSSTALNRISVECANNHARSDSQEIPGQALAALLSCEKGGPRRS